MLDATQEKAVEGSLLAVTSDLPGMRSSCLAWNSPVNACCSGVIIHNGPSFTFKSFSLTSKSCSHSICQHLTGKAVYLVSSFSLSLILEKLQEELYVTS